MRRCCTLILMSLACSMGVAHVSHAAPCAPTEGFDPRTGVETGIQEGCDVELDGLVVMTPAADEFDVMPGITATRVIRIQNRTRDTITVDLDTADVVGSDADRVVDIRYGERRDSARWASLDRRTISIRPRQVVRVRVRVAVPADAAPGSHTFGVSSTIRPAPGAPADDPVFKQVAIFIAEVPGDVRMGIAAGPLRVTDGHDHTVESRAPILSGRAGDARIGMEVENTGERITKVHGTVTVQGFFDDPRELGIPTFTTYPGGSGVAVPALDDRIELRPGIHLVRIALESDAGSLDVRRLLVVS
jgi:hypothetical protein